PFVEDAMKHLIGLDLEHRDRAAADARIDVLAHAGCLVLADPRPKALTAGGLLGGALRPRRRDEEKQCTHDRRSLSGLHDGLADRPQRKPGEFEMRPGK